MIRSANEVSGLVFKAARGAGLPLGVAEDLASAIPLHVVGPVEAALVSALGHLEEPGILLAHVRALDRGENGQAATGDPVLRAIARQRLQDAGSVIPGDVSEAVWAALDRWAARTYVPATDASRRAGAGAGLTDND